MWWKEGKLASGGGFSTTFRRPSWQQYAVNSYFSTLAKENKTLSPGYNRFGRGIPDVSLIGVGYEYFAAGGISYRFGTSCAAPVFAGMVSLVNAALKAQNKPLLGFLNPSLYSNKSASIFHDIVNGTNNCCSVATTCCKSGFYSTKG